MPRLLHLADVHLGARHGDLGEAAAAQRERQLAAFRRACDLAIAERVDLVLVCGDLFDSNAQPRRSVERAAAELRRLADAAIPSVLIPGTHDCYDGASIYRAFDLRQLAGVVDPRLLTVLACSPAPTEVVFPELDLVVYGRVFDTKRAPRSPLAGFAVAADGRARWRVGMIHGAVRIPGKVEDDDVIVDEAEIAASGLDYLALGHWHSTLSGRAGSTTWAYPGAPEPVAVDQDGAGAVLLVTLEETAGVREVRLERRVVGRTRHEAIDLDASTIGSQEMLVATLRARADPDLMLDVRLVGVRDDAVQIDPLEVSRALATSFLRVRLRDRSIPALPDGDLPPADTIAGAFERDLRARIEEAAAAGDEALVVDLREVLRTGRLLLADPAHVTLV